MTKYSEQFKLEVVRDYLGAGSAGLRAVAQRYGIPSHFTVRKWVLAYQVWHSPIVTDTSVRRILDFQTVLG
jgi:transposase-like protein